MIMQPIHAPKPKIFGKGYGAHIAYNYRLVKRLLRIIAKLVVNGAAPDAFYEQPHFEIIGLYYRLNGFRHGTDNPKRCSKCGTSIPAESTAEKHAIDIGPVLVKKDLPIEGQSAGDFEHLEDHSMQQQGIDRHE